MRSGGGTLMQYSAAPSPGLTMMMARPRTAGTAARRKQRAMAAARARAESRQETGRPQSARPASAAPEARRQSATARPEVRVGPSMVIPKLLVVLCMVCVAVGAITYALTSVESEQITGGKLAGIIIIVIGLVFLVASILVCVVKRIQWGAEHGDDEGRGQMEVSARQRRYAANHVEDETSRPPTRAWNGSAAAENGRPTSGLSTGTTGDIEMTLTSARQRDMFSVGAENGGFLPDNHHVAKAAPEIRVTCEAEDDGKVTSEGAYVADVHVTLEDDDLASSRPASIPPLDLSGVFPSPISPRKLLQNEAGNSDDEAPPMDSAPLSADSHTNPPKDTTNEVNGLMVNKQLISLTTDPDVIEMTVIKSDVTGRKGMTTQPETTFEHDVTSGQEGILSDVSPSDKEADSEEMGSGLFGSGGRSRVE